MRLAVSSLLLCLAIASGSPAAAQDGALPPRAEWHASSSTMTNPAMAPAFAIDGDPGTRWGGAFSEGHWLEIDMGKSAMVGGVTIHWDSGYASNYFIQSSLDGRQWQTAFEARGATGAMEYVVFPEAVQARYLRLASMPRTADWGVSVFEFEPMGLNATPRLKGLRGSQTVAPWAAGPARVIAGRGTRSDSRMLSLELPQPLPIAGLEVHWGAARAGARLEGRSAGQWQLLAEDPQPLGEISYLAADAALTVDALRLVVVKQGRQEPAVQRLRLIAPSGVMTLLKRYELAAARSHQALFPDVLHRQQVYWTVVGIPAARQKSAFDEYGNIEAFKGAPLVQPVWRDSSGRSAAAAGAAREYSLREGWMPIPAVEWSPQPGLRLRSEAFAIEQQGAPVTLVRHRLLNTGSTVVTGQLALLVRPLQVNPQWQHGGVAPINGIAVEGDAAHSAVRVNGRVLLHSLTPVDARGAAAFGDHGVTEITRYAADGKVPASTVAQDKLGLAAALLSYSVQLDPGAHRDIIIALPLGAERIDMEAATLPDSPPLDRASLIGASADASAAFDALADRVARQWHEHLDGFGLSLPDPSLVAMLRAQVAYMLLNQSGPAMQPGPRNYNRSFIRDGSATAAILLRVGLADSARDYLRWYAEHAVHENGLVSPILNEDGTVNRGFGSDIEYDSQGEFIWLVAQIARLDGGAQTVREYLPKVGLAMQFMQELRERTLVPGYMAELEAPQRFHGILAPSISHEGYATPTHSYWDNHWALKGWHDGAWLAQSWGETEMADWARGQYALLRESVADSIRATMAWKGIDTIPAAADLGDSDPSGVSIAVDPCGQMDLLPIDALRRTFARYMEQIRGRAAPDSLYAYTPYELRNVLTFVHLNQPRQANELLMSIVQHRRPFNWQVLAEVVHSQVRRDIYLGDMPHTWIGAEYVRTIFGMLMHEGDDSLHLLPGAPPQWLQGDGLSVQALPTSYGKLSISARRQGNAMRLTLGPGLQDGTKLYVSWPTREQPVSVTIDGNIAKEFTADGIEIRQPFRELVAQW